MVKHKACPLRISRSFAPSHFNVLYSRSFGIIAWSLHSCRAPYLEFRGQSVFAIFSAVRKGFRPPMPTEESEGCGMRNESLQSYAPTIFPPLLREMILHCLAAEPSERCTMDKVGQWLDGDVLVGKEIAVNGKGILNYAFPLRYTVRGFSPVLFVEWALRVLFSCF